MIFSLEFLDNFLVCLWCILLVSGLVVATNILPKTDPQVVGAIGSLLICGITGARIGSPIVYICCLVVCIVGLNFIPKYAGNIYGDAALIGLLISAAISATRKFCRKIK